MRTTGRFMLALVFVVASFGIALADNDPKGNKAATSTDVKQESSKGAPEPEGKAEAAKPAEPRGKPEMPAATKASVEAEIAKARTGIDAAKKEMASGTGTATDDRSRRSMERSVERAERMLDLAVKHRDRGELDMAMAAAKRALRSVERVKSQGKRGTREKRPEAPGRKRQVMEEPGSTQSQPPEGTDTKTKGGEQ